MADYSNDYKGLTVGLDLGDRRSTAVVMDEQRRVIESLEIKTSMPAMQRFFSKLAASRVAIETGTHAGWVHRLLCSLGHEVLMADSRQVALISRSFRKSDLRDAEILARLARADRNLLHPVEPRSAQEQADWSLIKSREQLVGCRTKPLGVRLAKCSAGAFAHRTWPQVPAQLREALGPIFEQIASLSEAIRRSDKSIAAKCESHPASRLLLQIAGVGPVTALAFLVRVGDPKRFAKSRDAGAFFGLTPGRSQSGDSDPQLPISKQGDKTMRRLLVNCARYMLGPLGRDCDLRTQGTAAGRPRRQGGQEEGGGGHRPAAGRADAPSLGQRTVLRPAAQQPPSRGRLIGRQTDPEGFRG